jgi:hypothetical protein
VSGGPSARCYHSMTYCPEANVAIVFGGYDGSQRLNDTHILRFDASMKWEVIGGAPVGSPTKAAKGVPAVGDTSQPSPRCWHTAVWARVPLCTLQPCASGSQNSIAPRLLVFGGRGDKGLVNGQVYALDLSTFTWAVSVCASYCCHSRSNEL